MTTTFHNHTQGTAEWRTARAGKLTASSYPDLMQRLKNNQPGAKYHDLIARLVVERLTGYPEDVYVNPAMSRGVELEPQARARYEAHTGQPVVMAGLATLESHPYVGASVDGLVGDEGLVEFKCPWASTKHLDALLNGSHATEYQWQIQGQLWITGRLWCDAVSFDPRFGESFDLAIVRVERNKDQIDSLRFAVEKAEDEIQTALKDLREKLKPKKWGD